MGTSSCRGDVLAHMVDWETSVESIGPESIWGASRVPCCLVFCLAEESRKNVCWAVASEGTADLINAGVTPCLVVVSNTDVASTNFLRRDLSRCCVACASTGMAP